MISDKDGLIKPHSFEETMDDVILKVTTLSPTKWLLINRETGQIYQGSPGGYWDKLDTKTE